MSSDKLFGILLLDKPLGISSNRALQTVKRLFGVKKAGHGGCLDPLATGVLPLYIGQATKFAMYSLAAEKMYRVEAKLGETTTTGDSEGEVTNCRDVPDLKESDLLRAAASLTGDIKQIPPMYSALKKDGQLLYRLARQGITVEREARSITIKQFELLSFNLPIVNFDVRCSKGTYIRTLMEDFGEFLGCGAYMSALRRTQAGSFSLDQTVTLDECIALKEAGRLEEALIPCEQVLEHLPMHTLSEDQAIALLQGKRFVLDLPFEVGQVMRLFSESLGFIGLGEYREEGVLAAKRMLQSNT